jgi:tRNA threonylcarbamoyladenosine biosynthesis protein TsaB
MSSLRQVLKEHAPLLLLDAASAQIQAGLFEPSADEPFRARWSVSDEEAGVGVFRCVEALGLDLERVRGFAFADSPGSILGIRTVAMALRVWCAMAARPVFGYNSLSLLAESHGKPDTTFIADARRDAWHACRKGGAPRRVFVADLAGSLAMPEGFRQWAALPMTVERVPYRLAEIWPLAPDADLLIRTAEPDAFLHEEPRYAVWQPQIHKGPET